MFLIHLQVTTAVNASKYHQCDHRLVNI